MRAVWRMISWAEAPSSAISANVRCIASDACSSSTWACTMCRLTAAVKRTNGVSRPSTISGNCRLSEVNLRLPGSSL